LQKGVAQILLFNKGEKRVWAGDLQRAKKTGGKE